MALKITTLLENEADEKKILKNEHGLSFLIEKDGHTLLFDTGESGVFMENAEMLGKDLRKVEAAAISHGHYDHSGGFPKLVEKYNDFKLYLGKGFFRPKFGVGNGKVRYNGNLFPEELLKEKGIDYTFIDADDTEIFPGVHILSSYPRIHEDEGVNPRFKLPEGDGWIQDRFTDEIMVAIETEKGIVAILGCSHPGMRNMLDAVRARLGGPIVAVMGGTHLVDVEGAAFNRSIDYLEQGEFDLVAVCHCTGKKAVKELAKLGERFVPNHSGSVFTFE